MERAPVPETVQVVLGARIHRLSARERGLIDCAAVIGRAVSVPLLRAATGLGDADLDAALETLQAESYSMKRTASRSACTGFDTP